MAVPAGRHRLSPESVAGTGVVRRTRELLPLVESDTSLLSDLQEIGSRERKRGPPRLRNPLAVCMWGCRSCAVCQWGAALAACPLPESPAPLQRCCPCPKEATSFLSRWGHPGLAGPPSVPHPHPTPPRPCAACFPGRQAGRQAASVPPAGTTAVPTGFCET